MQIWIEKPYVIEFLDSEEDDEDDDKEDTDEDVDDENRKEIMKKELRLMDLDDDDMVVDDTPPNSPGDNPPPPPPPSTNLLPPPPPPSHPPPRTPPSPFKSPPKSDAPKRGRIIKGIVVDGILDTDATTNDQPIPDTSDQLDTNDYEGFLDLDFMPQSAVPFNVVYLDSYFESEISQEVLQGTNSYIKSDDGQLNPRNRNASFLGGAHDIEARSSFTTVTGDPSAHPPKKKSKLILDQNELIVTWRLPIEEVREYHVRV
ncbi:unnamed protein product [Lactuca saligna]|uniref:Uncharacterized protein n=1 Tax=Lactuca saligna TaxID=75948 RepID=A0AA35VNQ3_LACSI|nr:unnamed protein product [Lactuca saligna]